MMNILGGKLALIVLQKRLRYSYMAWFFWLAVIESIVKVQVLSLRVVIGQTLLGIIPLSLLFTIFWQGKNGVMLIFASMIVMLYLGFAVMGMFNGTLAFWLYGIESIIILTVLFYAMWTIERLPKLNQNG